MKKENIKRYLDNLSGLHKFESKVQDIFNVGDVFLFDEHVSIATEIIMSECGVPIENEVVMCDIFDYIYDDMSKSDKVRLVDELANWSNDE